VCLKTEVLGLVFISYFIVFDKFGV